MSSIKTAFGNGLFAITLFVDDLESSVDFYGNKLGLDLVFQDESSALYRCANTYINLLIKSAVELTAPEPVGSNNGVTAVYTLPLWMSIKRLRNWLKLGSNY
jgi:catechol 2,3-dioxygenase-like lactoylglutathione lyase family enzyme